MVEGMTDDGVMGLGRGPLSFEARRSSLWRGFGVYGLCAVVMFFVVGLVVPEGGVRVFEFLSVPGVWASLVFSGVVLGCGVLKMREDGMFGGNPLPAWDAVVAENVDLEDWNI